MLRGAAFGLTAGIVLAVSACGRESGSSEGGSSFVSMLSARETALRTADVDTSNGVIDSVLAMPELLRRFQVGLAPTQAVAGGAASRDDLVAQFMIALEKNDTTTIYRLMITRAEYAYVYFPHSVYMSKPYELSPEITWMLNTAASKKGITRVLRRLGGQPLEFAGYDCATGSSEGPNSFWRECRISYVHPGEGRTDRRLFGTIIERDGRYKFLSYANDF